MKEEVLTVDVVVTGANEVKGSTAEACMTLFEGTVDCDNFKGKILAGGVDTQQQCYGNARFLSARYMLEGVDCNGQSCHIYIENNGSFDKDGQIITTPRIITDSSVLSYLETAKLSGTVEGTQRGVLIHIFCEK